MANRHEAFAGLLGWYVFLLIIAFVGPAMADPPTMPSTVAENAQLVELYSAKRFFEGPTWDPTTGRLFFTSFGEQTQILRLDEPGKVTVWADNTEGSNGTYRSLDERLLAAQAFGHRILSYAFDKMDDVRILAANNKWNQPNDICQTPNGNIYFTDPDFKIKATSAVFLMTPEGNITKIITDMAVPNGVLASNDGRTLYIGDSHMRLWRSYPIRDDGTVGEGREFFNPDTENQNDPDGMSIDEHGNLYLTGRGGVWVASPAGNSLGLIAVPEFCSNVTFGGSDGKTLYLTCSNKLYGLHMTVRGGQLSE